MARAIKKGEFVWLIVNYWGNFWNGTKFIMYHKKAKKYKTHGKALLALDVARGTIKEKCYKKAVTVSKMKIEIIEEIKTIRTETLWKCE
jgi:hypothetical protein